MRYTDYKYQVPEEKIVRVLIDTDAANEGDDQYAVVHALLTPKLENCGIIAAHYGIEDENPEEKSYNVLSHILDLMGFDKDELLFHGAGHALPNEKTPVDSAGARKIIEEAMKDDKRPLFVLLLGPLTDLASAYLMEPRIADRLTAIWIGGGRYPEGGREFNLGNDINAANVVFGSKIPVWQVPKNVYEMMPVSFAELEDKVLPCGKIGDFLFEEICEEQLKTKSVTNAFRTGDSWVLGDSPAVGLLLYEHRFMFDWVQAPLVTSDQTYVHTRLNRPIRVYRSIDPRLILDDMYAKLRLFAKNHG